MCLSKAAPSQETLEDSKPEPLKKKPSVSEPLKKKSSVSEPLKKKSIVGEAEEGKEVPREELENKTNEDLVSAEQVSFCFACYKNIIKDKIIHGSAISFAL